MTASDLEDAVSVLVVNFQTPELLEVAVRSFKYHYPHVQTTIVDNGSRDASRDCVEALVSELPRVQARYLDVNIFHGPAMDVGLRAATAPYVFVMDSDTETVQAGFLEEMIESVRGDAQGYGAGHVVHVNKRGFTRPSGIPVLSSAYMLLDARKYQTLPPFVHHGLPALQNFRAAYAAGLRLHAYPIQRYVRHLGRGTASRYGYGLGLRGKVDYVLSRMGF